MDIVEVSLTPHSLRFIDGGSYVSSVATLSSVGHRLLKVRLENGLKGVGEVARYPVFNNPKTEQLEDQAVREIENIDFSLIPAIINEWRGRGPALRGLAFALDCAWHDILAQHTGLPISVLLGGPSSGMVPEILSLSAGPKEALIEQIKKDAGTRHTFQISVMFPLI